MSAPQTQESFWSNPREGEFYVSVRVEATLRETVKASTKEEAREKIEAMFEAGSLDVDGPDIEDISIDYVSAESPMYLVHRPGTTVSGTTRIQPGDEPREPKDDYERRTYTRPPASAKRDRGVVMSQSAIRATLSALTLGLMLLGYLWGAAHP